MANPIQVQKYLKGVDYPATKAELFDLAEQNGADESIKSILNQIPDREYTKPSDVSREIGLI